MIAAYREPDRKLGKELMEKLIDSLSAGVPAALTELVMLGRTLTKRADDVLAYFDRPGTSNGPTEAINGRLEHLRGSALGFRNLTNYISRSLLGVAVGLVNAGVFADASDRPVFGFAFGQSESCSGSSWSTDRSWTPS